MASPTGPVVTRKDISDGLRKLGLQVGDYVIAHCSLSAFGQVEGGPEGLINAILDVLGPTGTVVFPTFTGVRIENMGRSPLELPPYTGIVPATARARADSLKSLHPLYSICAIGPKAKEICEFNDKYIFPSAEKKFLHKMAQEGGKTLLMGVNHVANSAVHMISEFTGVEYKVQDKAYWDVTVEDFLKLPLEKKKELMDTHMGYKLPYLPAVHLNAIDEPLRKINAITCVRIGKAVCRLMKIADVIKVGIEEGKKNPWFLCDRISKPMGE